MAFAISSAFADVYTYDFTNSTSGDLANPYVANATDLGSTLTIQAAGAFTSTGSAITLPVMSTLTINAGANTITKVEIECPTFDESSLLYAENADLGSQVITNNVYSWTGAENQKQFRNVRVCNIHRIKVTYTRALGYTPVDYIYFDGKNENYKYFYQTGYVPKVNTVVDLNCKGYSKGIGSWRAIFSGRSSSGNGMSLYQNGDGGNPNFGYFVSGNNSDYAGAYAANTDYTINFTKDALTVNSTVAATKTGIDGTNFVDGGTPITIFSGKQDWPFYGQISYFKISEGGTAIHEYTPVVRHDGVPALYDIVKNTYVLPNDANGFYYGLNAANTTSEVVKVSGPTTAIFTNATANIVVSVVNGNLSNYNVVYSSTNPAVATVDANGTIHAIAVGTTNIYVKATKGTDTPWIMTVPVTVKDNTLAVQGVEAANAAAPALLPSIKWGTAGAYTAHTWVLNTGQRYDAAKYNYIWGTPDADSAGKNWYDLNYTMTNSGTVSWNYNTSVLPNGWCDNDIMGELYGRRYFTVTGTLPETLYMPAGHDDAPCEYYINGQLIWKATDGWKEDEVIRLTPEQKALIKTDGTINVLAFHVHQNYGGRYADSGLYGSGTPVDAFKTDVKNLDATIAVAETEAGTNATYLAAINYAKSKNNYRGGISDGLNRLRMTRRIQMDGHHDYSAVQSTAPADGVDAYIYNVGAGLYLAGGNDWGTHASLNYASRTMILHGNTYAANCYDIQTNLPNGIRGVNDWLGHNGYVDCGGHTANQKGWGWIFEAVGDGTYRIINAQNTGTNIYLGMTEDSRLQVDTDKSGADNPYNHWKLITKAQLDELMLQATPENPADATHFIHQSTFSQNDFDGNDKGAANADLNDSPWERNAGSIWNWKQNNAGGDYIFEMWNTNTQTAGPVTLTQALTGLKPGNYMVSASGYYRDGDFNNAVTVAASPERWAYLTANAEKALLPAITADANKYPGEGRTSTDGTLTFPDGGYAAAKYFQAGLYKTELPVKVGADGLLTVGISKERTTTVVGQDWIVVDNFRLTYLGPDSVDVTVGPALYATYISPVNLDFTGSNVKAYSAQVQSYGVHLEPVTQVKAGDAIVVGSATSGTYKVKQILTTPADLVGNQLVYSATDITADGSQYVLAMPSGNPVGFYKANSGSKIYANKAFLNIGLVGAKNFYPILDGNEATSIDSVELIDLNKAEIYNLQGQKIASPVKGVNIINGKKVVIK